MATTKKSKQPADDPQLKSEVKEAVKDAKEDVREGNVATATEPDATVESPAAYQGHSHPAE